MKPTTVLLAIAIGMRAFQAAADDAPTTAKTTKEDSMSSTAPTAAMNTVRVRYMVNDLDSAVAKTVEMCGERR